MTGFTVAALGWFTPADTFVPARSGLWELPPNDRRYYPLYAECVQLGIPFCTQVGHTGPLRTSETGRPIPYLDGETRQLFLAGNAQRLVNLDHVA